MARKLLLVDDDRLILATTAAGLRSAGYEVVEAATVDAALALLAHLTPHLALLDIRMGPVGGFDLARQLRARGDVANWPKRSSRPAKCSRSRSCVGETRPQTCATSQIRTSHLRSEHRVDNVATHFVTRPESARREA